MAYYLRQFGIKLEISSMPLGLESWFPQAKPITIDVATFMVILFGAYLLGMTIAISDDLLISKTWIELCEAGRTFGMLSYLGGVSLLMWVGLYFFAVLIILIGTVVVIARFWDRINKKLRASQQLPSPQNSTMPV